jgi:hypothetical protein
MPAFVIFVNVRFGDFTPFEMFHAKVGVGSPLDLHRTVKRLPSSTISLLNCNSSSLAKSFCEMYSKYGLPGGSAIANANYGILKTLKKTSE